MFVTHTWEDYAPPVVFKPASRVFAFALGEIIGLVGFAVLVVLVLPSITWLHVSLYYLAAILISLKDLLPSSYELHPDRIKVKALSGKRSILFRDLKIIELGPSGPFERFLALAAGAPVSTLVKAKGKRWWNHSYRLWVADREAFIETAGAALNSWHRRHD